MMFLLKKRVPVLLSLTSFIIVLLCQTQSGKSLAEVLRNEHLVTVGNDSDGISKIWIVPRLSTSSPFVISLDSNFTVSSAYSAQSTKSRELTVISSYIGTSVSLHHLLVPLENSILNVTVKYNGSAGANETITVVRPHTLYRFPSSPCSHMCSSLGVHKIRGSLYALCASSTRICRCQLIPSNHQEHFDTTPLLSNCRLLLYPNADITVTRISDILSFSSIRNRPHLLFVLDKNIYQDNIVYDTAVLPIPFSTSPNCQVVLRLQIVESRLLIYCTNYTMVEYHFDEEHLFQSENHQYYPCSETANFSVNVTRNERADIHYQRLTDDSELRQQLLPPLGVSHFKVGECITYDGHDLFLYTNLDRSNNLHLINSSCSIFIPHNFSTSNLYERPLTVAERYIMIHSPDDQSTYVLDLENIEMPIITLEDIVPFQLATVISNLSFTINIEPTPSLSRTSFRSDSVLMSTATAMMPTDETDPPFIEQETIIWPPILIAIVVIICLCVLINGAVLIVWQCRRQKGRSTQPITDSSQTGNYKQEMLPTGSGMAFSNQTQNEDSISYASASHPQSSRNASGSDIVARAVSPSESHDGESRCSSTSPLFSSQDRHSSFERETTVTCIPTAESSTNEAASNAAQQVTGRPQITYHY